jgi:hypothetical protein
LQSDAARFYSTPHRHPLLDRFYHPFAARAQGKYEVSRALSDGRTTTVNVMHTPLLDAA